MLTSPTTLFFLRFHENSSCLTIFQLSGPDDSSKWTMDAFSRHMSLGVGCFMSVDMVSLGVYPEGHFCLNTLLGHIQANVARSAVRSIDCLWFVRPRTVYSTKVSKVKKHLKGGNIYVLFRYPLALRVWKWMCIIMNALSPPRNRTASSCKPKMKSEGTLLAVDNNEWICEINQTKSRKSKVDTYEKIYYSTIILIICGSRSWYTPRNGTD